MSYALAIRCVTEKNRIIWRATRFFAKKLGIFCKKGYFISRKTSDRGEMMEDERIIELYFCRDELAIVQTQIKYGSYCFGIAYNILLDPEDSEETVNDTYRSVWDAIPPHRPKVFRAFLAKITRRLSMKKLRYNTALKRGGDRAAAALEELSECIPDNACVAEEMESREVGRMIDLFLKKLRDDDRRMFVRRYFYLESAEDIAVSLGCSRSRVYSSLDRTRGRLKEYLVEEGVFDEG